MGRRRKCALDRHACPSPPLLLLILAHVAPPSVCVSRLCGQSKKRKKEKKEKKDKVRASLTFFPTQVVPITSRRTRLPPLPSAHLAPPLSSFQKKKHKKEKKSKKEESSDRRVRPREPRMI